MWEKDAAGRLGWMDSVRGLAVVLVVVTHAAGMATSDGGNPVITAFISTAVNPLRMPSLVFLAGLLASRSLEKKSSIFLRGKTRQLLYPFALWSFITIAIELSISPRTGQELSSYLLSYSYNPPAVTWYLLHLFAFYATALILRRYNPIVIASISAAVSIMCGAFNLPDGQRFFTLLAIFLLSSWLGHRRALTTALANSLPITLIAAFSSILFVALAVFHIEVRYSAWTIPLCASVTLLTAKLMSRAPRNIASGILEWYGRNSIVVYLVHWFPTLVTIRLMQRVGIGGDISALTGFIVGLGACSLTILLSRRYENLNWLFTFRPTRDDRRS